MKDEIRFQLQALMDGELSAEDADRLRRQLQSNSHWQQLYDQLAIQRRWEQTVPERQFRMPCRPEFFCQGVMDRLERPEQATEASGPRGSEARFNWKRLFSRLPYAVGVLVALAIVWFNRPVQIMNPVGLKTVSNPMGMIQEPSHAIESRQADSGLISFRSQVERVSVVWVSPD